MHPYIAKSVTYKGGYPVCCLSATDASGVKLLPRYGLHSARSLYKTTTQSPELHSNRAAPHGCSHTASETVEQPLHGSSVMTGKSSGPAALASKYSFRLQWNSTPALG